MIKNNWAGNVSFSQADIVYPKSEIDIHNLVLKAIDQRTKLRAIGSGHSFSELCKTNQTLVSLDHYQGLVSVDKTKLQATVRGGTKLNHLGDILFGEGLAMENMGDIDAQSIAGTISTGTHGTGINFGTISTQVIALKIITGNGEIIDCSNDHNADLFKAAQVSLGVFGIIAEVTLQCVPSYKLLIQNRKESLEQVLTSINDRNESNRNFEYYWMPYTDTAWTKSTNIVEEGDPEKDSYLNYLSELLLENYSFKGLCELARVLPSLNKTVSNIVAASVPTIDKLNYSHKVYTSMRMVKFTEMEYNVPAECYQDVMKEVVQTVNAEKFPIHFPIESRWVKKDDIYMSPAYGRDSAYIACHVYHKKSHDNYFKRLEDIFKSYGGRPHWGKINTFNAQDIESQYPHYSEFVTLRKQHDPENIFLNTYLENLF